MHKRRRTVRAGDGNHVNRNREDQVDSQTARKDLGEVLCHGRLGQIPKVLQKHHVALLHFARDELGAFFRLHKVLRIRARRTKQTKERRAY